MSQCSKMYNERSDIYETACLCFILSFFSVTFYCNSHLCLDNPATSVGHSGATDTTDFAKLIYNVEASDDPNLMACPFCPAVRWKTL